jgi:hypothetical protein
MLSRYVVHVFSDDDVDDDESSSSTPQWGSTKKNCADTLIVFGHSRKLDFSMEPKFQSSPCSQNPHYPYYYDYSVKARG